jgi:hypothetical protein
MAKIKYQIYTRKPLDRAIETLVRQKESRGYIVKIQDIESFPAPSYEAVRRHVLDTRPDYILLVGDSTGLPSYPRIRAHDGKRYYSDAYFSTPDGELLPTIPTGRISSMDPGGIQRICQTLVNYPENPGSNWRQRVVLTGWLPNAPGNAGYKTDCAVQCIKELGHYFLPFFEFERTDGADPDAVHRWGAEDSSKVRLKTTIERGNAIVRYVGHGFAEGWDNIGYNENFVRDDIRDLEMNGILPLVLSVTCLTGMVAASPAFSEAWQTRCKAIGVLSSDEKASTWVMDRLPQCIFRQIVTYRQRQIGAIFLRAFRDLVDRYFVPHVSGHPFDFDRDTLQQFRYYGDPDTALAVPQPLKKTLDDTSEDSPALAANNTRCLLAWTGESNHFLNVASSADGSNFGSKVTLSETSPCAPGLATFHNKFAMAWIGRNNQLLNVMLSADGQSWANKVTLTETSPSTPSLKFFNDRLYLCWRGTGNNRINIISSTDGRTWQNKVTLDDKTWSGPALNATISNLVLCWRGGPTNNFINIMTSPDGLLFREKVTLSEKTTAAPGLTNYLGRPMLAWRGVSNNYVNVDEGHEAIDGSGYTSWGAKITWRERCGYGGPALVKQGKQLLVAWTGINRKLNIMMYPVAPS